MAALTVRLDDDMYERLRAHAFKTRTPMARVIAHALLCYFEEVSDETTEQA